MRTGEPSPRSNVTFTKSPRRDSSLVFLTAHRRLHRLFRTLPGPGTGPSRTSSRGNKWWTEILRTLKRAAFALN
jgi:hypothetical protein